MKRILQEPLVHFFIIGVALFALDRVVNRETGSDRGEIVVSAGKVDHLAALFARTWQRPPTRDELNALVDDYVREEAAYREGLAMGLDGDDTIIRRRVRQKLDFIAEDLAGPLDPTDDDLRAYLTAHADDYRVSPSVTFHQIYFNPVERGERLEDDVAAAVLALNGAPTADPGTFGDRILLDPAYTAAPLRSIANTFGDPFAQSVAALEPGKWHGPIPSGYGAHAVRVDDKAEGRLPELDEVRDAVRRDWENARRADNVDRFYRGLLKKYDVTIEWPKSQPVNSGV